jgi:superfamily I DNA/RNA helicase
VVTYADDAPSDARVSSLRQVLDNLRKDGARPESVTVLSARRSTDLWQRREFGAWVLYGRTATDGNVLLETIHSYKGQDNAIVVLCELDDAGDLGSDTLTSLLYVGCSRARQLLIVIAPESMSTALTRKGQ